MRSLLRLKVSATYLGAVIGSQEFKDQYCREKVLGWKGELEALSVIARSQPHAAYTVFTKGYKSKFAYFMRTIESFEDYVDPIQEAIDDTLRSNGALMICVSSSL